MSVSTIRSTTEPPKPDSAPKQGIVNSDLLRNVRVAVDVQLGHASIAIEEMMALKTGSVIALQTGLGETVGLYVNENLVARGEIVAVGENYGVRIVEIVSQP
ncbi:MAG: FliM/FliN family flagellar motor switch protein [Alphaproteobacteria bacterium]|nr:FliM/FliN family flagellar motor switch protein [Alphaproteobacteria bacterium]MBV9694043.1 FliM/FliN family flagellar motor switch protein [Alphaproteobacteria bacterium]